jgi:L-lysine 2,3-aminomutase
MSARTIALPPRPARWQQALSDAVRSVAELARLLELPPHTLGAYEPARDEFALLVPRGFVRRMRKRDPDDPLLRQVLPLRAERRAVPGFSDDPLNESAMADGGVLEKYPGRVLLIASQACPVHCRYCFRRAFPYREQIASRADWAAAIARLRAAPSVREVILSGGDPLSLTERRLETLLAALAEIPWLERLRIHTRFPVVLPERIDAALLRLLASSPLRVVVVIHANHPNEIDKEVADGLRRLGSAGATLLNQSVLLRGVNDKVEALASLSERLLAAGVLPYYLHLLDPVAGAAHFEVAESEARRLHAALTASLPGYLVPRLVRETPERLSKTLIA